MAQSMGGLAAPLVAARRPVDLLVLVAAMVPKPGETGGEWWEATGQAEAQRAQAITDGRDPDDADPLTIFAHDLPPTWWPSCPLTSGSSRAPRSPRQERLGITADELPGDHLPALGHPDELVTRLEAYRRELARAASRDDLTPVSAGKAAASPPTSRGRARFTQATFAETGGPGRRQSQRRVSRSGDTDPP